MQGNYSHCPADESNGLKANCLCQNFELGLGSNRMLALILSSVGLNMAALPGFFEYSEGKMPTVCFRSVEPPYPPIWQSRVAVCDYGRRGIRLSRKRHADNLVRRTTAMATLFGLPFYQGCTL
jgi:hypothetical protein